MMLQGIKAEIKKKNPYSFGAYILDGEIDTQNE